MDVLSTHRTPHTYGCICNQTGFEKQRVEYLNSDLSERLNVHSSQQRGG